MASLNSVKDTEVESRGVENLDGAAAVLVAGAGPVGLTLACDLARRGVRTRLIEQGGKLFPGSRGKGLQPRTLEVLDDLGLGEAVRRESGPYPRMLPWEGDRPGEPFDFVEPSEARPGEPYDEGRMLPQWRTQELLYERLRELGGEVEFGTRLTGLEQDGDGVTAHLTGPDGASTTARTAFLVAADGGRSTVRTSLGIAMTGEDVDPHPALVADVRLTGLDRGHWHVWPHARGGALALCPLHGSELFQLAAIFDDRDHSPSPGQGDPDQGRGPRGKAEPGTSPDEVRALVAERSHLTADDVREVRWASVFRPRAALADRFRQGRVLLAGDAAHVHSPAGGQGLNTGIQDAFNLGWKLGGVLRHGAGDALLDTYEEERLPLAADVLGLSTRIHRGQQQRGRETRQLDIGYRDSSLAHELRSAPDGELRAGDRAPDAEAVTAGGERIRLFDAFRGPHWTLLAFGGTRLPDSVPDGVHAYELHGAEEHAEKAYGSGLFLVRPDGYLGAVADAWTPRLTGLLPRLGLR
ncbi:pentachlorophenol monooxygenase [Streptomyces sp. HNM0575]|uniref:FAD-dependent monooxygenase n=1 Tax=Streptomyces sp. HNM0575 TaxID=2716338 RepID=UPI00145DAD2B|nr:FAD-dependent monooxygenase [Streptomyces sp. HNM0575]NLU72304.1 pentachlorophenol monooxygenase [Streptomyces sp. HNM0575]